MSELVNHPDVLLEEIPSNISELLDRQMNLLKECIQKEDTSGALNIARSFYSLGSLVAESADLLRQQLESGKGPEILDPATGEAHTVSFLGQLEHALTPEGVKEFFEQ